MVVSEVNELIGHYVCYFSLEFREEKIIGPITNILLDEETETLVLYTKHMGFEIIPYNKTKGEISLILFHDEFLWKVMLYKETLKY